MIEQVGRLLIVSLALAGAGLSAAAENVGHLWISDDANRKLYQVSVDGELMSSFTLRLTRNETFTIPPSDITGGDADSLWVVVERPGRLAQFDKQGNELQRTIATEAFGALGPEGVAFDPGDQTLWVVDDPDPNDGTQTRVHHIDRRGRLLAQFPTTLFDPDALSPQAIALDRDSGTLWVTDNHADRVYNIDREGRLLRSFPVSAFDADATNLQGIAVSTSDDTLWVTDRTTARIYHLETDGRLLASFPSTRYDPDARNPTGIVFVPSPGFFLHGFESR